MKTNVTLPFAAGLLLAGCCMHHHSKVEQLPATQTTQPATKPGEAGNTQDNHPATQPDMAGIVRSYLQANHPNWLEEMKLPAVISDKGEEWEYTFELPNNMQGGVPVLIISKQSMKVVRAYHTQ